METKNTSRKRTATTKAKSGRKSPVKNTAKTAAKKDAAKDLQDLFEDSLKDIYWAEKALVKALPLMMKMLRIKS